MGLKDLSRVFGKVGYDLELLVITIIALLVLWHFRELWWRQVYNATCGRIRCCDIRNVPCLGWCIMDILCSCVCPDYHPPFGLRIIVHSAKNLRYTEGITGQLTGDAMDAYVRIKCGNNPEKTTSIQPCPSHGRVVWNEPLDFICNPADHTLTVEVWDQDLNADDLIGYVDIDVSAFYLDPVGWSSAPRIQNFVVFGLGYMGKHAGKIWLSFIMTKAGETLPEHVFQEGLAPKQQQMAIE